MAKTVARLGTKAVEKTPAKTTTITHPEVSVHRVGIFEYQRGVRNSSLKPEEKLTALTMSTYGDFDGSNIHPGMDNLESNLGVTRKYIRPRIQSIIKQGYMFQVTSGKGGRSQSASLYNLVLPVDLGTIEVNESSRGTIETSLLNGSSKGTIETEGTIAETVSMVPFESSMSPLGEPTPTQEYLLSTSTEGVDRLTGTNQTGTSQESLRVGSLVPVQFPVPAKQARVPVPDFDSLVPVHPDNARRARVSVPAPVPAEVTVPAPEVPVVSVVPPVSVPTVSDTTRKEDSMAKPKSGSFRSRMSAVESVFWSDEELDSLAEALGTDSSDFGIGFRRWLDGLVDFGQLDKETDLEFVLSHAKVCSTKKPSPVGYFKISLEDRLEQFKSEGQSVPAPVAQKTTVKASEKPVAASIPDLGLPAYVKGDLVSHAVSEALMAKLDEEDIVLNEKPAWLFWEVQRALKAIKLDENYADKIDEFRDGNGEKLSLDEFARRTVNYFWKNAAWADCSTGQAVVAMYLDPTNLRTVIKNLKTVYKNRRAKNGVK